MLMPKTLIFFIFLMSKVLMAQSVLVTSHYPAAALITERLLPFSIDKSAGLTIKSIQLFGANESCVSLIDPFYPQIFHVYCYTPATFNLSVDVIDGTNRAFSLSVGTLQVNSLTPEIQSPQTKPLKANSEGEG